MSKRFGLFIAVMALAAIAFMADRSMVARATPGPSAQCVHACNDAYKRCNRAEDARHKAALQACGSDQNCVKAEDQLHQANSQQCTNQFQFCKAHCN